MVGAKEAAEHTEMPRTSPPPPPCRTESPQPHIWSLKPHCSGLQFSATNLPQTIHVRAVPVDLSYPWFSPRVPDNPVLHAIADTPPGHGDDVVYEGLLVVFGVDATSVVRHLFCCHYATAERKQGENARFQRPLFTTVRNKSHNSHLMVLSKLLLLLTWRPRYGCCTGSPAARAAPGNLPTHVCLLPNNPTRGTVTVELDF